MSESPNLEELTRQAIQAALESDWQKAISLNEEILKSDPKDIEALNRLARACLECGNSASAKKICRQVLALDPHNTIALKNLKRAAKTKSGNFPHLNGQLQNHLSGFEIFLEEPGRTKIVNLVKLAAPTILSCLSAGCRVNIVPKKHRISVYINETYLGALPDDISHYLLNLISGGNRYEAFIKGIDTGEVQILIREVHRAPKFLDQPSFPAEDKTTDYYPFVREEALKTKEVIEPGIELTPEEMEEQSVLPPRKVPVEEEG